MSSDLFQTVRDGLQPRLADVLADILPGGRIVGREYCCASLEGGQGNSCRTNLQNGVGSDFATGERWSDIISLAAQCWRLRPGEAARELARRYALSPDCATTSSPAPARPFIPLLPVPPSAPEPPRRHGQLGMYTRLWRYLDEAGRLLACVARFSREDGSKVILPLSYGREGGTGFPGWFWKALPEPRPLYGLHGLALRPEAPVLLVEGEKTADAAQRLFPEYAVLTWSGGANAVGRSAYAPLRFRRVTIWPDNDAPGFRAVCSLLTVLAEQEVAPLCVLPPSELPEAWDLADEVPEHMDIGQCLKQALPAADFLRHAQERFPGLHIMQDAHLRTEEPVELELHSWPMFSWEACPGILGEFVRLATRDSEADPAAVCITALVRFCAEVYGLAPNYGPHIHVGETIHPPRLFAVICGNSSKARKGTSRHPVSRLFGRQFCRPSDLQAWKLPLPARESSGPLSTGEGLAFHVREESDAERERWQAAHPEEVLREKGDKRLLVMDEEFASGLACTRREGNTLSMGIRSFWDSGDYAPLTKNNPIMVRGAHINILTHITMQELAVSLGDVQAFNGFGNRFLWICARRAKLVPLPSPNAGGETCTPATGVVEADRPGAEARPHANERKGTDGLERGLPGTLPRAHRPCGLSDKSCRGPDIAPCPCVCPAGWTGADRRRTFAGRAGHVELCPGISHVHFRQPGSRPSGREGSGRTPAGGDIGNGAEPGLSRACPERTFATSLATAGSTAAHQYFPGKDRWTFASDSLSVRKKRV